MSKEYRTKNWWEKEQNVKKGDKIKISYLDTGGDTHNRTLYFDDIRIFDDNYPNNAYIIFQEKPENIGRKDLAVPIVPTNITTLEEIRNEPYTDKKRHIQSPNLNPTPAVKSLGRKGNGNIDFEIIERDGRFVCPCGHSYSQKGHAVWNHKKHISQR